VIIDNDGTDPVTGTFAGLPVDGTQLSVVATSGTQQQTQIYAISYHANDGNDVGVAYVTTATAVANLQLTPASINELRPHARAGRRHAESLLRGRR
jgi:hypothetical protein